MNENKVPDNGAASPAVPGVDVKIFLPKDPDKDHGKLLAFASANLGGVFTVKDIRIFNSEKGPFVSMPYIKGMDGKYYDICLPTTPKRCGRPSTGLFWASIRKRWSGPRCETPSKTPRKRQQHTTAPHRPGQRTRAPVF